MHRPPPGHHGRPPREAMSLEEIEEETEEMLQIRYINKSNSTFRRTEGGFVSLEFEGKKYDRIAVHRAFPFTDPEKYISVREADEKAREIGIVKNLADLSKSSADMLREQMNIRYFTPVIKRINDIKDEYGFAYFDVLTDRGACRFTIHMNGGSVVRLSETRILIQDLDGNRFEIPDITSLSAGELKKLDLFI